MGKTKIMQSMKNQLSVALLLALGLAGESAVQAESYGDLIVGFTTQSGSDHMYDLGSATTLVNGQTWNLATLLTGINLTTVHWGIIGDATAGDSSFLSNFSGKDTLWSTTAGPVPPNNNESAFGQADTGVNIILVSFGGSTASYSAGSSATDAATDDNSWNTDTLNPLHATDFANSYDNPNVIGLSSASFWQTTADSSTPVKLGSFSLASTGVLTYNVGTTPPTAGFTGAPTTGTAPLKVVFTDASSGTITNWLWTFGDGHSITNITSSNVTNTYAATGNYTVSLKVTGSGMSNTLTRANYIVVSAGTPPRINSAAISSGKFILSGTNGTASAQFRILAATNLALAVTNWIPVYTNNFLSSGNFAYTNSSPTNRAFFFRLVTP